MAFQRDRSEEQGDARDWESSEGAKASNLAIGWPSDWMAFRPMFFITLSSSRPWNERVRALVSRWHVRCCWLALHAWAAADSQCAEVLTPMRHDADPSLIQALGGDCWPSEGANAELTYLSPTFELWSLRYSLHPHSKRETSK